MKMKLLVVHCVGIFQTHLNLCRRAMKFSLNFLLIVIQLTEDLESNMTCLVSLNFQNNTVYRESPDNKVSINMVTGSTRVSSKGNS